jgi:hypothetical protein
VLAGGHDVTPTIETTLGGDHVTGPTIETALGDHITMPTIETAFGNDQAALPTTQVALGGDHVTAPTIQPALGGDHATVPTAGISSPFASPALSADSFVFHPNLGTDNTHNSDIHTTDFGHVNGQNGAQLSGLATSVPQFAPEFMFDPAHHDATDISATVSQFHQMASSGTLLHRFGNRSDWLRA